MAKYKEGVQEERFRWMRDRQKLKAEMAAGREPPRTAVMHRRREQRRAEGLPPHLQFYRVQELADMFGVSETTVTLWFEGRPGVIVAGSPRKRILLIPRTVLEAWLKEHDASRLC
jgi:hypothetical protein